MLLRTGDIRFVRADGHAVFVHGADAQYRYRGTLAECAARLPAFLRVHRGYLVNPDRVAELVPYFGGTYLLRMDDRAGTDVPVSRSYVRAVKAAFGM